MNIRCAFCQTPYSIGRNEMLGALQRISAENLNHYDAHCPRCKRATPIPRQRMEMFFPNWRDALKELEAEMKANPQHAAPPPAPKPAPVAEAESTPEPLPAPKAESKPPTRKRASADNPAAKKAPAKRSR
jgi:hypothetical protein